MARYQSQEVLDRALQNGQSAETETDLCIRFLDERDGSDILTVGGRWDRKSKSWADEEARSYIEVRLHVGQLEAAKWLATWFRAYLSGEQLSPPIYECLLLGGSRAGKTHLGIRIPVAFAIAVPGARVWVVQEADMNRVDECESELDELLPREYYKKSGNTYLLPNGSKIIIRSGHIPKHLKRGRVDFAFFNEAQNIKHLAWLMVAMRLSDTGGLCVGAANPPNDNPDGEWVAEMANQCAAKRAPNSKTFRFDPRRNPHINVEQLESIAKRTDPRTYQVEVLGIPMPPSNAVYHAYRASKNESPEPEVGDETTALCRRLGLGRKATHFVAMDFQATPHHVALIAKAYRNPIDPTMPLIRWVGEIIVDLGDEYDLSEAMYAAGLDPETTVIVADASGDWQDGAHQKENGTSFSILRKCGWKRIHVPDRNEKRNPRVLERVKNDNRLMASEAGDHIVQFDPDKVPRLIEAVKLWRRKGGKPDKRSKWAHLCDAMGYLHWRIYPRKQRDTQTSYKKLTNRKRRGQMKGTY